MSENRSKTVWYVTTSYRDHSSSPQISTPLRKVRVQEVAPFAVHRGGLYWTTICMMREWGDQMLYISLYLCCSKSGTLGSLFWLDRKNMTALGYKKKIWPGGCLILHITCHLARPFPRVQRRTWWFTLMALAGSTVFHFFFQTCVHLWPPNITPS